MACFIRTTSRLVSLIPASVTACAPTNARSARIVPRPESGIDVGLFPGSRVFALLAYWGDSRHRYSKRAPCHAFEPLLQQSPLPLWPGHRREIARGWSHRDTSSLADSAVVPYVGLFLIGMSLSRSCSEQLAARDYAAVARKLARVAVIAVASVLASILMWYLLKPMLLENLSPTTLDLARLTLDPRSKLPPSPAYFAFYGGGGLLIAAICLIARPAFLVRPVVDWAATLGRASLMCFVVQDWLLVLTPALLGFTKLQSMTFWTAYLIVALIVLHALATRWDRARANRFLTIGLKQSYAAWQADRSLAPMVRPRAEQSRPSRPR